MLIETLNFQNLKSVSTQSTQQWWEGKSCIFPYRNRDFDGVWKNVTMILNLFAIFYNFAKQFAASLIWWEMVNDNLETLKSCMIVQNGFSCKGVYKLVNHSQRHLYTTIMLMIVKRRVRSSFFNDWRHNSHSWQAGNWKQVDGGLPDLNSFATCLIFHETGVASFDLMTNV